MNELHTTINGVKEEGGFRAYYTDHGDPPAQPWEISWNGFPLPRGLRITDRPARALPNPDGKNGF